MAASTALQIAASFVSKSLIDLTHASVIGFFASELITTEKCLGGRLGPPPAALRSAGVPRPSNAAIGRVETHQNRSAVGVANKPPLVGVELALAVLALAFVALALVALALVALALPAAAASGFFVTFVMDERSERLALVFFAIRASVQPLRAAVPVGVVLDKLFLFPAVGDVRMIAAGAGLNRNPGGGGNTIRSRKNG
ncbi:MAG: hypothetical protein SFY96_06985 [Planctomycetota bacterium]|nr:hypothetical protein [Planctomycetota bacterium]